MPHAEGVGGVVGKEDVIHNASRAVGGEEGGESERIVGECKGWQGCKGASLGFTTAPTSPLATLVM
jgi:hypothetical protein